MNTKCTHCGKEYTIENEYLGKTVRCDACGCDFTISNSRMEPCQDCGAMISKRAISCPHCGAPGPGNSLPQPTSSNSYDTSEEKEVFKGHPAPIFFLMGIIIGILLTPLLIGIIILIFVLIDIYCTKYLITTKRIVVTTGFINKKQIEIWIKDMRAVNLHQDLWQRIIGTGTITIGTAATSGKEVYMNGLKNAQEIIDKINALRK